MEKNLDYLNHLKGNKEIYLKIFNFIFSKKVK